MAFLLGKEADNVLELSTHTHTQSCTFLCTFTLWACVQIRVPSQALTLDLINVKISRLRDKNC